MTNGIPITADMVKLAQLKSRATGCDVRQELARLVAQDAIMNLDPEFDLLVDEDAAFSRDDRLVATFDANDLVVNGARFDVRLVGEDSRVSMPRFLVGTSYMNAGTLAVSINGDRTASVVGFVPRSDWDLQDKHAGPKEEKLIIRVNGQFDLAATIRAAASAQSHADGGSGFGPGSRSGSSTGAQGHKKPHTPHANEIHAFMGNRQEMKIEAQRQLVESVLTNEETWKDLQSGLSKQFVRKTLNHAAVWNSKLEKISEAVQPKFSKLSKDEVKNLIARLGEQLGGQAESPSFRKEMLVRLTREELGRSLKGEALKKANAVIDQIFAGRAVLDVVKDSVKNKAAIDLAVAIKGQRQKFTNFIEATTDELSFAFRQLALQPAYATHSQSDDGLEAVNEALKILDACELAESISSIEKELAAI